MYHRLLVVFALSITLSASVFAADSNHVYVLKHADSSKGIAFVKTDDTARLRELMEIEGYELVARQTENGVVPVTGDVLPETFAANELKTAQSETNIAGLASMDDGLDIGAGANIGLTTGGKLRIVKTFGPGLVAGVDLDAGTIIFITDATVNGILGWSFQAGNHVIRPYLTVGAGSGVAFGLIAVANVNVLKAGAGVEWKPARWFGLGIEGGLETLFWKEGDKAGQVLASVPFARLTTMFYFR